ncbi:hypothetical protein, partial [Spirillospora sp. NPDC029432]|uniref:hypothetical protein n=1 Tax=Spirillospora sp. NPDC029432 TaxID=3154599 RepID=UPI0034514852
MPCAPYFPITPFFPTPLNVPRSPPRTASHDAHDGDPEPDDHGVLADRVREALKRRLPAYMVPSAIVTLDALP